MRKRHKNINCILNNHIPAYNVYSANISNLRQGFSVKCDFLIFICRNFELFGLPYLRQRSGLSPLYKKSAAFKSGGEWIQKLDGERNGCINA